MKDGFLELRDVTCVDDSVVSLLRIWRNSEAVRRNMLTDHIISEDEHRRWLEGMREQEARRAWVVYFEGNPIGFVQLSSINRSSSSAEWGMYIGEDRMRGLGLGERIIRKLMNLSFSELKLRRLQTKVLSENEAAISLYKKVGFREETRLKDHLMRGGKYIDVIVMVLDADDWKGG